ncbi:glycoside hydrolase family 127 protein [Nonomuraea fuscirosea]|uniref:glycoside hydrolase family 127 protein n=1 Tax=Nonomuraea fuscirosea TaxID=1291556 RepID=UPI002DDBEF0A|nr:beta-L-arabinofuranosidase domain-containing protein [Nonomuraea fuscirosea]WSA55567.1 glycoside hydrolase family 127 protein [Nonomuraea fuscirosea]
MTSKQVKALAGAVRTAAGAVRPVPGARITGGLLHHWQVRNGAATIPHTIEQLRAAGNVANLSRLLEQDPAPYRGRYPFLDTDLYKTLEGLAYELGDGRAAEPVREFYDEVVGLLERVQAEDGYLNSFFQDPAAAKKPWEDLAWGHELYNLGHLVQAAVAAARRMGDERLLRVAGRFADLVVERFAERGVCGHPEVEMALVELYRETGVRAYLDLAAAFVDRRGSGQIEHSIFSADYFQDHVPFRELPSVTGHAVRMAYLAAGAADVFLETGDRSLFAALERLWDDMVASKLYLTGGLGSRHSDEAVGDRYELPSERAYSETCAAIAVMQWGWRMFLATGGAKYLDVFERVLYNAYAVGLSEDGRAFFYDNPLQRRPDHEQRSGAESGGEPLRRSWFGCPCCPPNIVRWMAQLADYVAAERDGALLIACYTSARITGERLDLAMETSYPWDGDVGLTVERAPEEPYGIVLRVPGWARGATVTVNGEPHDAAPSAKRAEAAADSPGGSADGGWLRIERRWAAGDEVRLTLPMPVRAHGSHPHLDATRGALGIARGPLVYCVEQQDSPSAAVDDLVVGVADVAGARAGRRGEAVVLGVTAGAAPPPSTELYPELPLEQSAITETAVSATFVPYFLWGNRGPEAMRVWVRSRTTNGKKAT